MYSLFLTRSAEQVLTEIYDRGYSQFGPAVADAYNDLIGQALTDLMLNPYTIGTKFVSSRDDKLMEYHIRFANVRAGKRIKNPRHKCVYYVLEDPEPIVLLAGFYREGQIQVTKRIEQKKVIQEFEDQR